MRIIKKSDENFETLRNAINEAILKNRKVAKQNIDPKEAAVKPRFFYNLFGTYFSALHLFQYQI